MDFVTLLITIMSGRGIRPNQIVKVLRNSKLNLLFYRQGQGAHLMSINSPDVQEEIRLHLTDPDAIGKSSAKYTCSVNKTARFLSENEKGMKIKIK